MIPWRGIIAGLLMLGIPGVLQAQAPVIHALLPGSGTIGSSVIIDGENFQAVAEQNIVYFGPVRASVLSASPQQLVVSVPAGATLSPPTVTANGRTGVSPRPFTVRFASAGGFGAASLAPQVALPSGSAGPYRTAICDIDRDGKADLAAVNYDGNSLSVFRNIVSNDTVTAQSFSIEADLSTGLRPQAVQTVDLDNDGALDLVSGAQFESSVDVYRNTSTSSSISLDGPHSFPTEYGFKSIAVADLDGDGRLDLVVAVREASRIIVLRNSGAPGVISFEATQSLITGGSPEGIVTADIDGDGRWDILAAQRSTSTIAVFPNISAGGGITFGSRIDIAGRGEPVAVAIADFDGDGRGDPVTANLSTGDLSFFPNISTPGAFAFGARVDVPTLSQPRWLSCADMNGDGKADIAVVSSASALTGVHINEGTGGGFVFAARVDFPLATASMGLVLGDLTGDGKPEISAGNRQASTVSVLQNRVLPPPRLGLSTGFLTFPDRALGDSADATVYLRNLSPTPLTVTAAGNVLPDYHVVLPLPLVIQGNDSAAMRVVFRPLSFGLLSDTVRIISDGGDTLVTLSGVSPYPAAELSRASIGFGRVPTGLSVRETLAVRNTSLNTLRIDSLATKTSVFVARSWPIAVPGNDSCMIVVTFTPLDATNALDTLLILNNSSSQRIAVPLSGMGVDSTYTRLAAGWNLVSLGRHSLDLDPNSVFAGKASPTYGFNNDLQAYEDNTILDVHHGYWVYFNAGRIVGIAGTRLDSAVVTASRSGWVLLGSVSGEGSPASVVSDPPGKIVNGTIYGFDRSTQLYYNPAVLPPGEGFWVLVSESCTIKLRR
jgi:hypothetical protein